MKKRQKSIRVTKEQLAAFEAYAEDKVMKVRKQLCEMMPCGHPVAALNRQDQKDDGLPHTMYCRSCSFEASKNRGTVAEPPKESTT